MQYSADVDKSYEKGSFGSKPTCGSSLTKSKTSMSALYATIEMALCASSELVRAARLKGLAKVSEHSGNSWAVTRQGVKLPSCPDRLADANRF